MGDIDLNFRSSSIMIRFGCLRHLLRLTAWWLLAPTGALVVAPLPLFHITSSRSSKSLYNLLTLLKSLEHLCLYI